MPRKPSTRKKSAATAAPLGHEARLWQMADALRNNMDAADKSKDALGRVYEYFLSRFARAAYDPCCGSGGMFVQSEKFIEAHAGKLGGASRSTARTNSSGANLDARRAPGGGTPGMACINRIARPGGWRR